MFPKHLDNLPEDLSLSYRTFDVDVMGMPVAPDANHGSYDPYSALLINPTFGPTETVNTLLHELMHAIFHLYAVGVEYNEEEKLCMIFGNALTELFNRNPDLLDYLRETLHGSEHDSI